MRRIWSIAFLVLASTAATAALGQIPLCEVSRAADKELATQMQASARIATQLLKTTEEFESLMNSRDWKEKTPVGEQMTPMEAERFGTLRQTMSAQQLSSLYESKRERDVRVLARMTRLADQMGRYGFEPPVDKKSEDYFLYGTLFALREAVPIDAKKILELPIGTNCTLSNALLSESKHAVQEALAVSGFDSANRAIETLNEKYGGLDASKMSKVDRQKFVDVYLPIAQKGIRQIQLAQDLRRLALLDDVSRLLLKGWRQDQYEAPGDMSHTGTTWSAWVRSGEVSNQQNELTRFINFINEKLPADVVQKWDELSRRSAK